MQFQDRFIYNISNDNTIRLQPDDKPATLALITIHAA
jgi:hypothetical protein